MRPSLLLAMAFSSSSPYVLASLGYGLAVWVCPPLDGGAQHEVEVVFTGPVELLLLGSPNWPVPLGSPLVVLFGSGVLPQAVSTSSPAATAVASARRPVERRRDEGRAIGSPRSRRGRGPDAS